MARRLLLAATCSAVAALAVGWPAVGAAAEPGYAIVTAKTKTIKATDSCEIHTPDLKAKAWVLVAAQAPECPGQSGTSTRLVPDGEPWTDLSPRNRPLLRSLIPVTQASLQHTLRGRVEFQATLFSRKLVQRQPGQNYPPPEKLSKAERQLALAETPLLNFSSEAFQRWLQNKGLHKKPNETDLDFGRRAFLAISHSYQYHYAEEMDRHASVLCQTNQADCGGMSVLFASTLRANKIPARLRVGHWARSEDPKPPSQGRVAHKAHVKSEFYAAGVGWVPIDLSSAVEFDKSAEGLRFFGNDPGDFLTVHLDYEVEFDSGLWGVKSLRHLQSVHYYVRGDGNFDTATMDRNWHVETIP